MTRIKSISLDSDDDSDVVELAGPGSADWAGRGTGAAMNVGSSSSARPPETEGLFLGPSPPPSERASRLDPSAPPMRLVLSMSRRDFEPPFNPDFAESPPAYHEIYPAVPVWREPEYAPLAPPAHASPAASAPSAPEPSAPLWTAKEDQEREDERLAWELFRMERENAIRAGWTPENDEEDSQLERRSGRQMNRPGAAVGSGSGSRITELDSNGNPTELRRISNPGDGSEPSEQPRIFNIPLPVFTLASSLLALLPEIWAYIAQMQSPQDRRRGRRGQIPATGEEEREWQLVEDFEVPFGHYPCGRCNATGQVTPENYLPRSVLSWLPNVLTDQAWLKWTCPRCQGTGLRRKWWFTAGKGAAKFATGSARAAAKGAIVAGGWWAVRQAGAVAGLPGGLGALPVAIWAVRGVIRSVNAVL